MTEAESGAWATGTSAITLFVEDVSAAEEFYKEVIITHMTRTAAVGTR